MRGGEAMTASDLELVVRKVHFGLVWGASLLVPASKRRDWSEEWRTELWYVLRECSSKTSVHPRSVREATAFCMGAYRDAIWLRKRSWQNQQSLGRIGGSASACVCLLMGIFLATWGVAHISSRVAAVNEMSRIRVSSFRLSDKLAAPCDCVFDARLDNQLQKSSAIPRRYFDGFSHYNITRETAWASSTPRMVWTVAHAPSNFFAVTNLSVQSFGNARTGPAKLPRLVLSEATWIRDFRGKQNIAGAELRVGSVDAIVAGVASRGSSNLPGEANAWLLDFYPQFQTDSAEFVVGHLTPVGYFQMGPRWALSLAGMVLAFLLVPCIMRSPIGEYDKGAHKPSLVRRSRFWAFLITKIAFLLAIVYFASVDLDCVLVQPGSLFSGVLQGASAFILCCLGLSWAFRDQQRRCPVCLRRLSHPVEVGQPSRTFLAWNGTELVCERGHILLHIPGSPTSWFGAQRWVCLDGSWQFLFSRPSGTPGL